MMHKKLLQLSVALAVLQSAPVLAQNFQQQTQLQTFATDSSLQFAVESNFLPAMGYQGRLKLSNQSNVALAAGKATGRSICIQSACCNRPNKQG